MRFLAQNKFDFNTLFQKPINYGRLSDMENIYSKCVNKAGGYNPDVRSFEALSTKNQDLLEQIMDEIREWVYDHKSEKRKNF